MEAELGEIGLGPDWIREPSQVDATPVSDAARLESIRCAE